MLNSKPERKSNAFYFKSIALETPFILCKLEHGCRQIGTQTNGNTHIVLAVHISRSPIDKSDFKMLQSRRKFTPGTCESFMDGDSLRLIKLKLLTFKKKTVLKTFGVFYLTSDLCTVLYRPSYSASLNRKLTTISSSKLSYSAALKQLQNLPAKRVDSAVQAICSHLEYQSSRMTR